MGQNKASRGVIARAHQEARRLGASSVEPEHVFVCVMDDDSEIQAEVRRTFDLDPARIRREVEKLAAPAAHPPPSSADLPLSRAARRVIEAAEHESQDLDCEEIAPEHLLLAVLKQEIVRRALARLGIKADDVREATLKIIGLSQPGTEGDPPGPPGPKEVGRALIDKLKHHAPDILRILPLVAELWKRFPGGDLEPEHYRMLLEKQISAITFIAMIEEKKQRVYVSPQVETILGYTPKEWLKDPSLWYDRLHPEDRLAWERDFAATLANRRASVFSTYRFLHRDGHPVWIQGNVEIAWKRGNPLYVQAVGFDVTEIKENEEKLKRHEEELSQRAGQLEAANRDLEHANRELERLKNLLSRADQREIVQLKAESKTGASPEKLLQGGSDRIRHVRNRILEVAASDAIVLITGETGTGKQLVAQAVHYSSGRKGPFVEMNCADYPENLLEDELFGHERGSYTGADRRRRGCLEQASGGTLFLDEIGDMPKFMQGRLLKVLDGRPFKRIGGEENVPPVDVRVVCATNRDLKEACREKTFRDDLYRRIKAERIEIPALRDRKDDIPLLARHFLTLTNRAGVEISPDAMRYLEEYSWPANVAELKDAIASAARRCDRGTIRPQHLPEEVTGSTSPTGPRLKVGGIFDYLEGIERSLKALLSGGTVNIKEAVKDLKRVLIKNALESHAGILTHTAESLQISDRRLADWMREVGLR